ncbi:hypothetical protein [Chamaesiphon sp. OTE_20_metabat_361]|uniref:hypothetical protein n=1 Tax=Chamaesiphon sp. OTE_20_metabat_361 TaxID=2964689 RepID=UPI00286D367A|nr:hypothetical protein [Chamaesiphon sp. OTE_20_metabat_361]
MPIRKKRPSASDVLRQEMQQPLVIPARNPDPEPNPTPSTNINMTPTQDDAVTAAQLKKVQESEAKLQQQIEDLNSKLKAQADTIVKLAEQSQAPAKGKSAALVKKDTSRSNASITARPTESREETARRRANTDIGWLD